jgi:hypothetical protein
MATPSQYQLLDVKSMQAFAKAHGLKSVIKVGNAMYVARGFEKFATGKDKSLVKEWTPVNQVLSPKDMSKYKPEQMYKSGGHVYLLPGVAPVQGTYKPVNVAPGGTGDGSNGGPVPTGPGKYTGNGSKFGELPKSDGKGHYSWIKEDGSVYAQPGYALDEGKTGWEYLGDHRADEFSSAEALYKTQPMMDQSFDTMTDAQKKAFIDQAHKDLDQRFITDLAQGQTDTLGDMVSALKNYKDTMQAENWNMHEDVKNTIDALESSGMSFTGKGREKLGDWYAAGGILSAPDRAKILENITNINAIRNGAIGEGATMTAGTMPKPKVDFTQNNPQTGKPWSEDEINATWAAFMATPEWKGWSDEVTARMGTSADTGVAGTGTYGLSDQLNRFAGTRALEGSVMQQNRNIMESSRRNFNNNIKTFGTAAEKTLGTGGLAGFTGPTIGGVSIFNPAKNVFGTAQGGFQTNLGTQAGTAYGNAVNQQAYNFNI